MAVIQWNNNLSVGIVEIDEQHKKLVKMINELYDAMKQGKGKDVTGKIINGLIGYTESHFRMEERYFDELGYPDAAAHKLEHIAFKQKVTEFKEKFDKGKITLSIEVMLFLSNWLQNHIEGVDKKYAAFFKEKGVK
ncbi:bacteriohemerythrin [Pannus brasiliensis CCIBt3594]|uniref:Bacteriohemerythrin n=1 Tax=Pannus brasiliensis CCIBt3594 TaxID=1427578 RepID=A0AAW9QX66_9CHRO